MYAGAAYAQGDWAGALGPLVPSVYGAVSGHVFPLAFVAGLTVAASSAAGRVRERAETGGKSSPVAQSDPRDVASVSGTTHDERSGT